MAILNPGFQVENEDAAARCRNRRCSVYGRSVPVRIPYALQRELDQFDETEYLGSATQQLPTCRLRTPADAYGRQYPLHDRLYAISSSGSSESRVRRALADVPAVQLPRNAPTTMSYLYYVDSCPQAYDIVRERVQLYISSDAANAAAILHLFFYDCFLQGCDASTLLSAAAVAGSPQMTTCHSHRCRRSAVALHIVDEIKAFLEAPCPGIVSCADTLALAARDAIFMVGGPWIPMMTGRKDRRTIRNSHLTQLIPENIPLPTQGFRALKRLFQAKGLDVQDLVALSGAHTIGQTDCHVITEVQKRAPTQNPFSDLSPLLAANLSRICLHKEEQQQHQFEDKNSNNCCAHDEKASTPRAKRPLMTDGYKTVHLEGVTPDVFDNSYFKNVLAMLHSDAALLDDPQALSYVRLFARNQTLFFTHFRLAFSKMSQLGVLTSAGEIRMRCNVPNSFIVPMNTHHSKIGRIKH